MKPIEPGCLALVLPKPGIDSVNAGKTVRVGKYLGALPGWLPTDLWEVDKPMQCLYGMHRVMSGKRLMRIDDYEGEQEEAKQTELTQ